MECEPLWERELCREHGTGTAAGTGWQPAPVLVASVLSRFLEWTVVGTASTRASVALKHHRCTLLSHGITEAH